jgi:broad specificity phosphatase PhoE
MELLFVRHAEPERGTDSADPGLSDRGRGHASALAEYLRGEHVDAVWSSSLRRALQTAAILAQPHGLDVNADYDLAEFDRDAPEYLHWEDASGAINPRYEAFLRDDLSEWGTDVPTFRARVVKAVDEVIRRHPSQRVLLVTHGGVINGYLGHVLGLPYLTFHTPSYTAISRVLASSAGRRQIETVNETPHLRAEELAVRSAPLRGRR